MNLNDSQIERYSRQIILKELGGKGQDRLLRGRVLVIGAGGLGSPCAFYLTAAGIGTVGVADGDQVELSNLQRQIIHATPDLGRDKALSARDRMVALNPETRVETYPFRIKSDNIRPLVRDYDFVIDATDNFPSKFLINDACVMEGKPFSHAGVLMWYGQAMTYVPGSACYRCFCPEPPPGGAVPNCSQAGILGAVAGILGSIQAAEAVKFLVGAGELLTNRLLVIDALTMEFNVVSITRQDRCPACG